MTIIRQHRVIGLESHIFLIDLSVFYWKETSIKIACFCDSKRHLVYENVEMFVFT